MKTRTTNPARIRGWLLHKKGMTLGAVAQAVGVDASLVSMTIAGKRRSRAVLVYLRQLGIPSSLIEIPAELLQAEEDQ